MRFDDPSKQRIRVEKLWKQISGASQLTKFKVLDKEDMDALIKIVPKKQKDKMVIILSNIEVPKQIALAPSWR